MEARIDAIKMYFYRRMLWIPWLQKVSNEEVLTQMRKTKEIMYNIGSKNDRQNI